MAGCAIPQEAGFVCSKCGGCCRLMPVWSWRNSPLFSNPPNPADKKPEPDISALRVNTNGRWCEVLREDNLCGLWVTFGKESLPPECMDFPANDEQMELCRKLQRDSGVKKTELL